MEPTPGKRPLRKRAIAYGFLLDTVLSILVFGVLAFVAAKGGVDPLKSESGLGTNLFEVLVALGFTVLGAFIAGRIAGFRERAHGTWVGVVGLLLGLPSVVAVFFVGAAEQMSVVDAVSFALAVPGAFLGGLLAEKYRLSGSHVDVAQETAQTKQL